MRNITCFLLTLALVSVAVRAQQPGAQTQAQSAQGPAVTFKVEINYVEVDAVVTDAQGNVVRDLTANDFDLLEDGKPQKVTAFSLVNIPIERAERPLFATTPIPPDVLTQARIGRIALGIADGADQDHRVVYALVQDAVKFNGGLTGLDANEKHQLVFPDDPTTPTTWAFAAILTGFEPDAPYDDKLSASLTFKVTGKPTLS